MREYIARLKSLKWQAMQLRGEQLLAPVGGGQGPEQLLQWGFSEPLHELPETGMSELGQLCRAAGAEELLHAVLKI